PRVVGLAAGVTLDAVDEQERPRRLVAGGLRAAALAQHGWVGGGARDQLHDRDHGLAEARVGPADDHHVTPVVAALQPLLALLDEPLLAAGVHHEGIPTEEHEPAVGLHAGPIARDGDPYAVDQREG